MVQTTTLEQSEHLLKLGINPNSADMWWSRCCIMKFDDEIKVAYSCDKVNLNSFKILDDDVPAWSLSALLYKMKYPSLSRAEYSVNDWICCSDYGIDGYIMRTEKQSPIEAAYKIVEHLLEHKFIKS